MLLVLSLFLSLPLLPSLFSPLLSSVCVLTEQGYQVLHLRYRLLELTNPFNLKDGKIIIK